ncbi:hypothetical protein RRG08_064022 [Elysia crispata]|uniref:Uncharacterized protein n=1 Tax=Elysia crispata TaxID=231223 RepID=A0AAE0YEV4_9GAST|nr:hypothetical protein RRG08_064022 [Elysia crispata]
MGQPDKLASLCVISVKDSPDCLFLDPYIPIEITATDQVKHELLLPSKESRSLLQIRSSTSSYYHQKSRDHCYRSGQARALITIKRVEITATDQVKHELLLPSKESISPATDQVKHELLLPSKESISPATDQVKHELLLPSKESRSPATDQVKHELLLPSKESRSLLQIRSSTSSYYHQKSRYHLLQIRSSTSSYYHQKSRDHLLQIRSSTSSYYHQKSRDHCYRSGQARAQQSRGGDSCVEFP